MAAGLLVLASTPQAAQAQLSGSISAATDFKLRGVSLTEHRPALVLSGAYDNDSGVYAGASLIAHDPAGSRARLLGHTEYLGYAVRRPSGVSWDVGVANVDLTLYRDRKYPLEYRQFYVGVARDNLSARVSYSPDFPRSGVSSVYLDLNGVLRPAEDWRLTGHFGALHRLGGRPSDGRRERYDVRFGVTRALGDLELQASWTAVLHRPRPKASRTDDDLQLGVSYFF